MDKPMNIPQSCAVEDLRLELLGECIKQLEAELLDINHPFIRDLRAEIAVQKETIAKQEQRIKEFEEALSKVMHESTALESQVYDMEETIAKLREALEEEE